MIDSGKARPSTSSPTHMAALTAAKKIDPSPAKATPHQTMG
jgi:hypothetical protein